jgi:hypothetical protein
MGINLFEKNYIYLIEENIYLKKNLFNRRIFIWKKCINRHGGGYKTGKNEAKKNRSKLIKLFINRK